ncbi:MAG: hypothetical protein LT071_05695 [Nocardioides sp.]|nr:hypothetical protein [Nocardioides sp.]
MNIRGSLKSRGGLRRHVVALLIGVLLGGGLMTVTPAGATVQQAAATNWAKIWKKKLRPLADKRYARKGSSYTKAQSDAKYAPAQRLYRGTIMMIGNAPGAGAGDGHGISFGATFPSAPTPHYIKLGDPVPAGCSGTAAAPDAAPGHLCVFESEAANVGTNRGICRGGSASCSATDPFGATVYAYANAAGTFEVLGTWAARPSGPVVNPRFAPAPSGAVNGAESAGAPASAR